MKANFREALLVASITLVLASMVPAANAANIGNWDGSSRSWNSSDFSIINSTMVTAGHSVEADEAMTSANLINDNLLIIGEAALSPNADELSALSSWVNSGGRLLVFADSGDSGVTGGNAIFSALGTSLSFGGYASSPGTFQAGNFATNNIYNIVGATLSTSPGTAVSGGSILAGDFIHYQKVGSGWVFAFGDRSDHNYFAPSSGNVNGQLFLNIAAVPEPETYALMLTGIGLIGAISRRRKQKV